jgi:hypothetical protein
VMAAPRSPKESADQMVGARSPAAGPNSGTGYELPCIGCPAHKAPGAPPSLLFRRDEALAQIERKPSLNTSIIAAIVGLDRVPVPLPLRRPAPSR